MFRRLHRSIIIPVRDFMYPPVCMTCNGILAPGESRVCTSCWGSFPALRITDPAWIELQSRLDAEGYVHGLLSCFLFQKEGKLQDVIHLLKYRGMKSLGVELGREIGNRIGHSTLFSSADCCIPVPLHKRKKRERGFNQSDYLCRGIADITGLPLDTSLVRRRLDTGSQTRLERDQRKANLSGAFEIHPRLRSSVQGKTFILVDDVITTGSTINACARELMVNGAARVLAASVALAQ